MPADQSIIIRGFLTVAKAMGDPAGRTWIITNLTRVVMAAATGATTIKLLMLTGFQAQGEDQMRCDDLIEIFQSVLEQWDADAAGESTESDAAPLTPVFRCGRIPY